MFQFSEYVSKRYALVFQYDRLVCRISKDRKHMFPLAFRFVYTSGIHAYQSIHSTHCVLALRFTIVLHTCMRTTHLHIHNLHLGKPSFHDKVRTCTFLCLLHVLSICVDLQAHAHRHFHTMNLHMTHMLLLARWSQCVHVVHLEYLRHYLFDLYTLSVFSTLALYLAGLILPQARM